MSYNLNDSTIVTFIKKGQNNRKLLEDGFLNLSPAGAIYIEGCGARYEKIE
jgi:hypothetical protein